MQNIWCKGWKLNLEGCHTFLGRRSIPVNSGRGVGLIYTLLCVWWVADCLVTWVHLGDWSYMGDRKFQRFLWCPWGWQHTVDTSVWEVWLLSPSPTFGPLRKAMECPHAISWLLVEDMTFGVQEQIPSQILHMHIKDKLQIYWNVNSVIFFLKTF